MSLSIDDRLETAAQLVLRTRIFYDTWRYFEGAETRPAIFDTMRSYSEFFRFNPHANFVAFIVQLAALFERREDTINLPQLVQEMKRGKLISTEDQAKIDEILGRANPLASKVRVLRNNLFAHRSARLAYRDAFKMAKVTPNQLRDLTKFALAAANGGTGA